MVNKDSTETVSTFFWLRQAIIAPAQPAEAVTLTSFLQFSRVTLLAPVFTASWDPPQVEMMPPARWMSPAAVLVAVTSALFVLFLMVVVPVVLP